MDFETIQQRLHDFCDTWKPHLLPDKEVLPRLLAEYKTKNHWREEVFFTYLELLVESDSGLSRDEIYRRLWPGRPLDRVAEDSNGLRNRLNADLLRLASNNLANYQIRIYPSSGDDPAFDDLERIEKLVSTTSAVWNNEPLESNRFTNPQLKIACAAYDVGSYILAIELFDKLLPMIQQRRNLTNLELSQFLYFLAKTLLKLNWYESLSEFLSGPYRQFSRLLQDELNAEILQIDGMRYRQQLDIASAHACFDRARGLLTTYSTAQQTARLTGRLADICVLKTQAYLDQALNFSGDALAQETNLELAEQNLEEARRYFREYWRHTRLPTHYEGRLRGTHSFLTVVRSLIFPKQVSEEAWVEAEANARRGFEPEDDRKPYGIVAGKYALAIVWLAKGKWLRDRGHETARQVESFENGLTLLSDVYAEYISAGHVFLGPRYELPKVQKALIILRDEVMGLTSDSQSLLNFHIDLDPQEAQQIAGSQICIYTPLV